MTVCIIVIYRTPSLTHKNFGFSVFVGGADLVPSYGGDLLVAAYTCLPIDVHLHNQCSFYTSYNLSFSGHLY